MSNVQTHVSRSGVTVIDVWEQSTFCFLCADAHHVPGVGHQEVLSHVSRKQVEQDSLVVQLHLLHVVSLLFCLDKRQRNRGCTCLS